MRCSTIYVDVVLKCSHTFSHMIQDDKSPLNFSICNLGARVLQLLYWGWWWPTSPSTWASLYHAGLLNAWGFLSGVPLTHLSPYLPPRRSLEKGGKSSIPSSIPFLISQSTVRFYISHWTKQIHKRPIFFLISLQFDTYSTAVITGFCVCKGQNGRNRGMREPFSPSMPW